MRTFSALLLLPLALLAAVAPARAGPIQLRWNECAGSAGAELSRTFACDASTGTDVLVVSLALEESYPAVTAAEVYLYAGFDGNTAPSWWQMNTGECRAGAFTAVRAFGAGWTGCHDPWPASAVTAGVALSDAFYPHRVRLLGVTAVPAADSFAVAPSADGMYLLSMVVSHARTDGAGACEGCADLACVFVDHVMLHSGAGPAPTLISPNYADLEPWMVLWNAAPGVETCPAWVPVRNRTWGQIKSLYR